MTKISSDEIMYDSRIGIRLENLWGDEVLMVYHKYSLQNSILHSSSVSFEQLKITIQFLENNYRGMLLKDENIDK